MFDVRLCPPLITLFTRCLEGGGDEADPESKRLWEEC